METEILEHDIEDRRKPVTSLREYLHGSKAALKALSWIWQVVVSPQSRKWLTRMFVMLVAVIVLQTIMPAALRYVYDGLMAHDRNTVVWGMSLFAVLLFGVKNFEKRQYQAREWVYGMHRGQIYNFTGEKFLGLSIGQHMEHGEALASTNINKGTGKALEVQDMMLISGIQVIMQLIISFLSLFVISPFSGCVITVVIVSYFFWSIYLNYKINEVCVPLDKDFRRLERRRTERMEMFERVKISAKEGRELREMSDTYDDIIVKDRKFWLWYTDKAFCRSAINGGGMIIVMSWGVHLVWIGEWNIGWLYPLFTWTQRVCENIWQLGDIEHRINWNMPIVQNTEEALAMEPEVTDVQNAIVIDRRVSHHIEFRDVSHGYSNGAGLAVKSAPKNDDDPAEEEEISTVVKRVSLTIKPGEKKALIGRSGCGKTTFMRALMRVYDPTSGQILIDGVDLREIAKASWLGGIGYIPQHAQVFDGSIRYNLTFDMDDEERAKITDDEIWQVMRLLKIDFGKRLTHGLDTLVGKSGLKLSGGQAQRLMIGAAVIKKPWLLVIDEATSSLDPTTVLEVQEGLETVLSQKGVSALIVAHNLSTVRHTCDQFVMLKPSEEVRNGDSQVDAIASSFEELAERSALFAKLAADQGIVLKDK